MKFNFCPTCGEYLNLSYGAGDQERECSLGHQIKVPKTVIVASAILPDQDKLLMERKYMFNREFWTLPHIEVNPHEAPENTLSKSLQSQLSRNVSVESLVVAGGDEQMFHLFYEIKLLNTKTKHTENLPQSYSWYSWQDMPWDKIAYRQHKEVLLQWIALSNDSSSETMNYKMISQYRGMKIL